MPGEAPVIVLHHRLTGDFNNALGIAEAIGERLGAPVEVSHAGLKLPFMRYVLAGPLDRLKHGGGGGADRVLCETCFSAGGGGAWPRAARCIVSTLGGSELAAVWLAALTGAPAVHLGSPKRARRSSFDAVIAHPGHAPCEGEIALPIVPSRLRRAQFADPDAPERQGLLLAIGGSLPERPYRPSFWPALVEGAARLAAARGRALWVTTSPRSGTAAETAVAEAAARLGLPAERLVLFGRSAEPASMATLLARCGEAMVTADSTSMLSDALASGARVAAATDGAPPALPRVAALLDGLVSAGSVVRWNPGDAPPALDAAAPLSACWTQTLWQALAPVFALRREGAADG